MRKMMILGGLAAAALASAQPETSAVRKQMERIYAEADTHMAQKNLPAFFSHFDPNFVSVNQDGGRTSFRQFKRMAAQMPGTSRRLAVKTRIRNVQLQSREAVVWLERSVTWSQRGRDGNLYPVRQTSRWAETLVRRNGDWKFIFAQELFTDEPWSFKTTG